MFWEKRGQITSRAYGDDNERDLVVQYPQTAIGFLIRVDLGVIPEERSFEQL